MNFAKKVLEKISKECYNIQVDKRKTFSLADAGMWLSLVERCVRDAKAAGSNPVIPTKMKPQDFDDSAVFYFLFYYVGNIVSIFPE